MRTDNPEADAIIHINSQETQEYEHDHTCNACEGGFDNGHGVKIEDEKFCSDCIDGHKHYDFYAECGLNVGQVYELTNKMVQL